MAAEGSIAAFPLFLTGLIFPELIHAEAGHGAQNNTLGDN